MLLLYLVLYHNSVSIQWKSQKNVQEKAELGNSPHQKV